MVNARARLVRQSTIGSGNAAELEFDVDTPQMLATTLRVRYSQSEQVHVSATTSTSYQVLDAARTS